MSSLFRKPSHNKVFLGLTFVGVLYILSDVILKDHVDLRNLLIGITLIVFGLTDWLPREYVLIAGLLRIAGIFCAIATVYFMMFYSD